MAPEAFTNTELAEAMTWRESQPEYIQKMTGTPSSLMSFYKQVLRTRGGKGTYSTKSSEEFKVDLKNLADGLRSFEKDPAAAATPKPSPPSYSALPSSSPVSTPSFPPVSPANAGDSLASLDAESMKMVREVQQRLNLSHDREALRALIKLGYEKISQTL